MTTEPAETPEPCFVCGWQYPAAVLAACARGEIRLDMNPTHVCAPSPVVSVTEPAEMPRCAHWAEYETCGPECSPAAPVPAVPAEPARATAWGGRRRTSPTDDYWRNLARAYMDKADALEDRVEALTADLEAAQGRASRTCRWPMGVGRYCTLPKRHNEPHFSDPDLDTVDSAAAPVPAVPAEPAREALIAAARHLHRQDPDAPSWCMEDGFTWPCATIRALTPDHGDPAPAPLAETRETAASWIGGAAWCDTCQDWHRPGRHAPLRERIFQAIAQALGGGEHSYHTADRVADAATAAALSAPPAPTEGQR